MAVKLFETKVMYPKSISCHTWTKNVAITFNSIYVFPYFSEFYEMELLWAAETLRGIICMYIFKMLRKKLSTEDFLRPGNNSLKNSRLSQSPQINAFSEVIKTIVLECFLPTV